jgi:hypothetical protein
MSLASIRILDVGFGDVLQVGVRPSCRCYLSRDLAEPIEDDAAVGRTGHRVRSCFSLCCRPLFVLS